MFHNGAMTLPPADPFLRLRARGAATNPAGRFEPLEHARESDGWDLPEEERLLATEVREERPRSLINYVASPDLPFDRTINPYRGCEHGCSYCFARPGHGYLGLSPGLDFETRLIARPEAAAVLARELGRRSYRVAPIAIGTNTDPYQPIERRYRIMRAILQVLSDWNHPVSVVTKGTLIERDIDLLSDMAGRGLVQVGVSVTTLDPALSRAMEPRAPAPARRLAAISRLTAAGVPVRLMVAPVVPVLTDHELEALVAAGAGAGVASAGWILLRLTHEMAPLFRDWLAQACPGRAAHVLIRLRETSGGADYDAEWGKRMRGEGVHADLIARRFALALRRHGLDREGPALRCDLFAAPPRPGDQMALF